MRTKDQPERRGITWRSLAPALLAWGYLSTGPSLSRAADAPPGILTEHTANFVTAVDEAITTGIKRSEGSIVLSDQDRAFLLAVARRVVETHFSDDPGEPGGADVSTAPETIHSLSNRVYVTLRVSGATRGCQSAGEGNLLENLQTATALTIRDKRFGGPLTRAELPETRIDLMLLSDPVPVEGRTLDEIGGQVELGIHGISLRQGNRSAFFKSSVPVSYGYSLERTLERLGRKAGIGRNAFRLRDTDLHRFDAVHFAERADKSLVSLHRCSVPIYQSDVTPQRQREALRLCGEYLNRHVGDEGLMTYDYDAYEDETDDSMAASAVVRRLAGAWALARVGRFLSEPVFVDGAKLCLEYYLQWYYVQDPDKDFGYIQIGDDANIAMAAFLLLALVETGDLQFHAAERQQLANFLLAMEDKGGSFLYPVYLPDKHTDFESKEIYYPGEALTAMMSLHRATGDKRYVAVAERVFGYYHALYKQSPKRVNMTPWLSRAYGEVYAATGDRRYADFVLEMNDELLKSQRGTGARYADKIGSFFGQGASYSTGVMVESIAEAYRVAKALDDRQRMETYRRSILMGNRFLMQCQYTRDNMFAVKNPGLALGGVRTTITTSRIRIDAVQHAACALHAALEHL